MTDHLHDFTIQNNIPIYDSYHEQTPMPVPNHNLFSDSQDVIRNYSDPINLASSFEKEDISSQSQLCCNISCTDNHCILFRLHSFCIKSNYMLNFQTFDRLLWHVEHLIKEHSKDVPLFWKAKLCQGSIELSQFQDQSISDFLKKLLWHPKHHQPRKVPFETC